MNCPWASLAPANLHFCEAPLCAWVTQPADTWTNVGFLIGVRVQGWRYDEGLNAVLFDSPPRPHAQIRLEYATACLGGGVRRRPSPRELARETVGCHFSWD